MFVYLLLPVASCMQGENSAVSSVESNGNHELCPVWVGKELGGEGLLREEEETHSWFEEEQIK